MIFLFLKNCKVCKIACLTWAFADKSELSLSYMHAFSEKVNGSGSIPGGIGGYGGGEANIEMQQNSLGLAYGVSF